MRKTQLSFPDQAVTDEILLLRQQLRELTEEASHNESVLKRFHDRELELLAAETLQQLVDCLIDGLKNSFDLPYIKLILHDPDHELRHLLLHSGISPEHYPDACFLDQLEDFDPILCHLRKPWLGPFLGDDHGALFPSGAGLQSVAILPMIRRGRLVGLLGLGSRDKTRFTRHHASDFLNRLATIGAICLENTANREHLIISGLTDALTSLHNRRYLERRLNEEVSRAQRYKQPLSCLFIDADHFKQVNDNYGHAAGDAVLRELALRVKECLRASDVATRFGGEEFALLLPQTGAKEAVHLAERIRERIERHPISIGNNKSIAITISIGVSKLPLGSGDYDGSQGEILIDEADKALYQAKQRGRNRVALYQTPDPEPTV